MKSKQAKNLNFILKQIAKPLQAVFPINPKTVKIISVLSVDYLRLPDYSLNDCLEDVLSAYRYLLMNGYKPDNIFIGGDSADFCFTLSLLHILKAEKISLHAGVVLISPISDISTGNQRDHPNKEKDHMFNIQAATGIKKYHLIQYPPYCVIGFRKPGKVYPI